MGRGVERQVGGQIDRLDATCMEYDIFSIQVLTRAWDAPYEAPRPKHILHQLAVCFAETKADISNNLRENGMRLEAKDTAFAVSFWGWEICRKLGPWQSWRPSSTCHVRWQAPLSGQQHGKGPCPKMVSVETTESMKHDETCRNHGINMNQSWPMSRQAQNWTVHDCPRLWREALRCQLGFLALSTTPWASAHYISIHFAAGKFLPSATAKGWRFVMYQAQAEWQCQKSSTK